MGFERKLFPLLSPAGWKGTYWSGHIVLHALHKRLGQVGRTRHTVGVGKLWAGRGSSAGHILCHQLVVPEEDLSWLRCYV